MQYNQINPEILQAVHGVSSLISDPNSLTSVFDIVNGLKNTEIMAASFKYLKTIPEVAAIIEEKYIAPPPDLNALMQLSPESLGHAYASAMINSGFDPQFYLKYRSYPELDDKTYIGLRMGQTHDIWHIVTGFGVSGVEETGLQSFVLAQNHFPTALLIMTGAILNAIKRESSAVELGAFMKVVSLGYQMGAKAKPLLAVKWEEEWDKPVTQWRTELNIEPWTGLPKP